MSMRTVIIISADAEWRAARQLLPDAHPSLTPFGEVFEHQGNIYFHGGWGKVSAAATTQYVIDRLKPDLLVNLGTCGGFEGRIERGIIILVEKTILYDIFEQMTDGSEEVEFYTTKLELAWLPSVLPFPVLRGLLISGDRDIVAGDIPALVKKYDAVAADWESGAIAWTARKNGTRLLILRGVSDLVGEDGGEAYGDYTLFTQRTREIMKKLFDQLPKWLAAIEQVGQGYRGY
jgi:adenosylhomocysteine nucleosidase